mgnify:CR=1 FL=1|jgi:hypothetical protein
MDNGILAGSESASGVDGPDGPTQPANQPTSITEAKRLKNQ